MTTTTLIDEEQELKSDLIRSLESVHDVRFLRGQLAMVRIFAMDDSEYGLTREAEKNKSNESRKQ